MWFRNLQSFKFIDQFTITPEKLSEQLAEYEFREVRSGEQLSRGWVSPQGEEGAPLGHAANGFMLVCLRTEEKMVPTSVIREKLKERIEGLEAREGRKVYKKEKDRLKDEIFYELLSRAFSRNSRIFACIDARDGTLFVDAASSKKAEILTTELRRATGTLKIELPKVNDVSVLMTDWIHSKKLPESFVALDSFVVEDKKTGGMIRGQKQEIFSDEIQSLLDGSRSVIQLALSWKNLVSFVLKDDFSIRSVKFLQDVKAQSSDVFTETAAQRFDADFTIMSETLREFWGELYSLFKG